MPLIACGSRQQVDQRFHVRIDSDSRSVLATVQTLDGSRFFQQVFAGGDSGSANLKAQIVFDFLERHLDRVIVDRA